MKTALSIGNFDGVHRGHAALVASVTAWRQAQRQPDTYRSMVLTFEPHPVEIKRPGVFVARLTTLNEKIHLLQNLGVDEVRVVPFTEDFSQTPARDFFDHVLVKDLDVAYLAIGRNFYFGRDRQGTPDLVVDWCTDKNIAVHLVDPVEADGAPVSSTRIRKLIDEGQMAACSRLLGRNYSITGEVVYGDQRGRQLGFPTANLLPKMTGPGRRCVPQKGVYLSCSTVEGKTFASVTNVGVKPTVSDLAPLTIETHLLDFNADLYGKTLTVEFIDRLRGEMKFASIDELSKQIHTDTQTARTRLRAF